MAESHWAPRETRICDALLAPAQLCLFRLEVSKKTEGAKRKVVGGDAHAGILCPHLLSIGQQQEQKHKFHERNDSPQLPTTTNDLTLAEETRSFCSFVLILLACLHDNYFGNPLVIEPAKGLTRERFGTTFSGRRMHDDWNSQRVFRVPDNSAATPSLLAAALGTTQRKWFLGCKIRRLKGGRARSMIEVLY